MIGRKRKGLGQSGTQTCTSFYDPGCSFITAIPTPHPTGPSTAANYPGFPAAPMPVPVAGPSADQLAQGAASSWTPEQALAATKQAQNIANIQFFQNIATPGSGGSPAGVDCTDTWTYYTNSACPADCSRFFTNLFNSTCPGLGLGWSTAGILGIAAGVLLLVVVIRR